ncbi:UNVERIFIED_CONTAM: protein TONNEAU 1b, partial [Sesamum calycinum]
MDDYTREMMDLKTLVTRTLEKKGVLAKIRVSILVLALIFSTFTAELRASVFEAIEEEDKVIEKEEGLPPALLGSCNERAKQLHNSPSGNFSFSSLYCFSHDLDAIYRKGHVLALPFLIYLPLEWLLSVTENSAPGHQGLHRDISCSTKDDISNQTEFLGTRFQLIPTNNSCSVVFDLLLMLKLIVPSNEICPIVPLTYTILHAQSILLRLSV